MMRRARWVLWVLAACGAAAAQQNEPQAAFVYPAGGRLGSTFEITVGGEHLDGAQQALVSGEGVGAEVVGFTKPLAPKDLEALQIRLKELNESHGSAPAHANPAPVESSPAKATPQSTETQHAPTPWTPEDKALAADLRHQIDQTMRLRAAPALSEQVSLRVTIAAGAATGRRELRLLTDRGLTNPLVFLVDRLPESTRSFQFVPLRLAAGGGLPLSPQAHAEAPQPQQTIELPAILNGQIMPGGVDSYSFHARKGQTIVIAAMTRTLIPYIADAVPGWFQAALTLRDSTGRELAYADHSRFHQEPVIAQEIPADGDYILSVRDLLNRGREDFVYRIVIGEIPYVTGIFPLGGRAGSKSQLELAGWNLIDTRYKPAATVPGVHPFTVKKEEWNASPLAYSIDTLPESTEQNPAPDAAHARRIKLPQIVNGRIDRPGAGDYFRIDAKAGEEIVAEVEARRLGSPLDSTLTLTDAHGKQLAFNDDFEDKGAAFLTHQADSRLTYRFATKGRYYLQLADCERNGGPDYTYRLRISHPRPDFEVRIAPSSINVRPGRTVPVTVLLLRRDGFEGAVKMRIKDGPSGLVLSGGEIPAGVDIVRVGLTAPSEAIALPHKLTIEAETTIGNRIVRHEAMPADERMQAFAWHQFVPAQEGLIWMVGKERRKAFWNIPASRLQLASEGSAILHIDIPRSLAANPIQLTLVDPPAGIAIADIKQTGQLLDVSFSADGSAKPGLAGNLIVAVATIKNSSNSAQPTSGVKPTPIDFLPAIPFAVHARP